MFIRYYLELGLPLDQVAGSLFADPTSWVPGLVRETDDRAKQLLTEVGFDVGESRRIDREVEIQVGTPREFGTKTLLPISWTPRGSELLFPRLDADIEVAPLGAGRTQLSMSARYRPPLGVVGKALDKALLHRVAEATIKDFVDRMAERLAAGTRAVGG